MRTEYKLFIGLGLFMLPLGIAYAIAGGMTSGLEPAGTILLIVVAISFTFIGVYLLIQARRMDGLRPEDWDATPADGQGEVGSFPVASIWPFLGATGATLLGFGLVYGAWIGVPGLGLILATVIGMARETDISGYHHPDLDHAASAGHDAAPTFSDNVKK